MAVERHQVQEENVGAYVLGALDEVELRAFEDHLMECPVCRDEVEHLRTAVEALPRAVTPVNPPARLKASLMEAVEADAKARSGSRQLSPLGGLRERLAAAGQALGGMMRPGVAWATASAALVLVVGALTAYAVTELGSAGEDSVRTLAAKVDKGRVPLASASLVSDKDQRGAILRVHGMPTLERDATYQVWLKRDGEVISQSLFNVGPDGNGAAAVSESLTGADAVLVTRERAGGARAPSGDPVLSVAL